MRDRRGRLLLLMVVLGIMVVRSSVRDLLVRMMMMRGERGWWRCAAAVAVAGLGGVHVRGVLLLLRVGWRRRLIRKHGRIRVAAVVVVVCCRRKRMRVEEPDGDAVRLLLLLLVRSDAIRIVIRRLLRLYCAIRTLIRRRQPSSVKGCEQLLLLLRRRSLMMMIQLVVAKRCRGGRLLELP